VLLWLKRIRNKRGRRKLRELLSSWNEAFWRKICNSSIVFPILCLFQLLDQGKECIVTYLEGRGLNSKLKEFPNLQTHEKKKKNNNKVYSQSF